ncbi:Hypothetical predicted protein [Mytilus galloprovincialis]|uniref:DNA ligase ATP-dependent N-terminal domain-containing protein n=1 Tax=Mytilus galloprovincialis TaxID=29158 RepID=A0A8B6GL28_MYTGA|nr:Hypothetical predicted protein [Mytilus galloprovincialis]
MISNLEYMSPLGKSDHCVLSFDYNCYINIKNKPRIAKLYDHGNYHDFKLELDKINWQEEIKDDFSVDTNWKYFLTTLNELEQRFVPTKKMTQIGKKKNAFPVDKKTRELIKRKNILSKKIVTNQDPEIRAEYNRSKTREGIGDLHTDPDDTKSPKTDDDKEKAEILSEYFASVFTQEPDGEIPVPNSINIANELTELKINKDMIMKHLKKLKIDKSPGPDKLHPRLLRETMESIAEPLSLIFNQSLNEKTVPKEWKNALVSAIFKKGNKSQAKNYRPVSLTSVVCKILEKIIREHIIKHMKLNRLFSNKQYGFISGRSTSLQLLEVIDKWTEAIDDGYEHMLAKLLIEVLCLGKDSPDANRLLNYKAPTSAKMESGDFASVAYYVLKNRCPEKGSLTIKEVNNCLDGIATNNAAKKKELVRKNILHLLTNMSAIELKWLIRMIVKELKVGLSQASVLSVYHPDAEEFYNVNNNLEKVSLLSKL